MEQPGWSSAGFKGNWANATVVSGPQGQMSSQMIPPIRYRQLPYFFLNLKFLKY
jgi:hypothetical protein